MRARPGFVSSWFRALAERPTSSAPRSERVATAATSGIPTSFRTPVVLPVAEVSLEPSLGAAPEIVRKADRGNRGDRGPGRLGAQRPGESDCPADERQPKAPVVDAERAGRQDSIHELATPVGEARRVPPGLSMPEVERDLLEAKARAERVDRHPSLAAEPAARAGSTRPALARPTYR